MAMVGAWAKLMKTLKSWRRGLLWAALIALVLVAQVSLLWLTRAQERTRLQDETDTLALRAASEVRQRLTEDVQALQQLLWMEMDRTTWQQAAQTLLRERSEVVRLEWRDARLQLQEARDSPTHAPLFTVMPRAGMELDAISACGNAQRFATPMFSRTYFVPVGGGLGTEVVDLCLPRQLEGAPNGAMVATLALTRVLESALPPAMLRNHEVVLIEADGTRLARAGTLRGAGAFTADRLIDVAGFTLPLRLDSTTFAPSLIPNLPTALVLALSAALSLVLMLLAHDMRRRGAAERQLADALSFRNAMEDSLVTGLRARDLTGRITYVNAAFGKMVGFRPDELIHTTEPPYWPPELVASYRERNARRFAEGGTREGFETIFMRSDGERFPVLVFEAPLVDGRGKHTGWMSTILDVSAQRKVEELSRQQQDKLQAAARLATMGEMATLLSHELNQPLAAIASYATGSLNLLPDSDATPPADPDTQQMIRQAVARIAEQAERAGRIIRSVHQFVRRREQLRENLRCVELFDAVLPLVRLAARRSHTRIDVEMADPPPRVSCDRTMVEQVLLNLARNGIQAMEESTPLAERVLTLRAQPTASERWVSLEVIDAGPGIPVDVAERLFTPFFTTKSEGMGIGLSMCRTVVEQHGGALDFSTGPGGVGTVFRFTLPAASGAAKPKARVTASDTPDLDPDLDSATPAEEPSG